MALLSPLLNVSEMIITATLGRSVCHETFVPNVLQRKYYISNTQRKRPNFIFRFRNCKSSVRKHKIFDEHDDNEEITATASIAMSCITAGITICSISHCKTTMPDFQHAIKSEIFMAKILL